MGSTTSMCGAPTAAVPVALEHVHSPGGNNLAGNTTNNHSNGSSGHGASAISPSSNSSSGTPVSRANATPGGGVSGNAASLPALPQKVQERAVSAVSSQKKVDTAVAPTNSTGQKDTRSIGGNLAARRNFKGKLEVQTTAAVQKNRVVPTRE